jgi:hypothetical protein
MIASAAVCAGMAVSTASPQTGVSRPLAERVSELTRASRWTLVQSIPFSFRTFHPQGLVKVGDVLFVSSVEITVRTRRFARPIGGHDRDAGEGTGHLFKVDMSGALLQRITLGEGAVYHPGGIDFDGTHIWVPVAEYRPDSRSIVYRVDPQTMKAIEVLSFADHIGAIVHDTDGRALHGASWGSRRFYRWTLDSNLRVTNADVPPPQLRILNPSHYVDHQDCQYAGLRTMLCGGISELPSASEAAPVRLGGLDLIDLADGRPRHQVPVTLTTPRGVTMTRNPMWVEATASGLRAYFLPEDDESTLYVYDVR